MDRALCTTPLAMAVPEQAMGVLIPEREVPNPMLVLQLTHRDPGMHPALLRNQGTLLLSRAMQCHPNRVLQCHPNRVMWIRKQARHHRSPGSSRTESVGILFSWLCSWLMALGLSLSPASGSTKEILAGNAPPDRPLLTLGIAAVEWCTLICKCGSFCLFDGYFA
jgi:hypothetical protein